MNPAAVHEAEQLVIGAVFIEPALARLALDYEVTPEWFGDATHQLIWRHIEDLQSAGQKIDAVTVASHIKDNREATEMVLVEIPAKTVTAANFTVHLDIMRRAYATRCMIQDAESFATSVAGGNGNLLDLCQGYTSQLHYMQSLMEDYTTSDLPAWRTEKEPCVVDFLAKPFEKRRSYWGDGLLDEQSRMIISGKGKIGKSLFVSELALRISAGKEFLGFPTVQTPVLYLQQEISEPRLQDRFNRLVQHNDNKATKALSVVTCSGMRVTLPAHQDWLKERIREGGYKIVILDPLYKFHAAEENSATEVKVILDVLDQFIAEFGISWILVHHHRKEGKDETRGVSQIRGTSVLHDWLDSALVLNEHEDGNRKVTLQWSLRNAEDPGSMILYNDPSTLSWQSLVNLEHTGSRYGFENVRDLMWQCGGQRYGVWLRQSELVNKAKDFPGCPASRNTLAKILVNYSEASPKELKTKIEGQGNMVWWMLMPPENQQDFIEDPELPS